MNKFETIYPLQLLCMLFSRGRGEGNLLTSSTAMTIIDIVNVVAQTMTLKVVKYYS